MTTKHDLDELRKNGKTAEELIASLEGKLGEEFKKRIKKYQPDKQIIQKLNEKLQKKTIVVFSAIWCKDCKNYTAALIKIIQEEPEIDAIFFSGIKTAPLDPDIKWKVPPSPKEVNEFNLERIPSFYILESNGRIINKIIEKPKEKDTLEKELLHILKK